MPLFVQNAHRHRKTFIETFSQDDCDLEPCAWTSSSSVQEDQDDIWPESEEEEEESQHRPGLGKQGSRR